MADIISVAKISERQGRYAQHGVRMMQYTLLDCIFQSELFSQLPVMVINLKTLSHGHSQISQVVVLSDEQQQESGAAGQVSCTATIDRLQWQIHAAISFGCTLNLECSRCLKKYAQRIEGEFRIILQDKNAPRSELSDEDVDLFFCSEDDEIDARGALYDEIMTAIPLMPLCSDACAGIAIETACMHSRRAGKEEKTCDPRWEALKKLKQEKD